MNYVENFEQSVKALEEDITQTVLATFRRTTSLDNANDRRFTAHLSMFDQRKRLSEGLHPWLVDMPADGAPLERDDIISEADLNRYVEGLERNGFSGPCSW